MSSQTKSHDSPSAMPDADPTRRAFSPDGDGARAPGASLWLRGAWWDLSFLAFCWVPFYLWTVFGLGIGREAFGWTRLQGAEGRAALATATVVALGITYIHRHYTFVLVYGDGETFARRMGEYIAAPLLVFGLMAAVRWTSDVQLFAAGSLKVTPWLAVLTLTGTWNVWHTVQQRYGIFRVYAGKARSGLEQRAHGRRDMLLHWSSIAIVAIILLTFRRATFAGHSNARRLIRTLRPVLEHPAAWAGLALLTVGAALAVIWWLRHELAAPVPLRDRVPRWSFFASTLLLLLVFLVHGPIVGYLCFGTAHALEYLAFVHHFGEGKYRKRPDDHRPVARLMRHSWIAAPILIGAFGLLYLVLTDYRRTDVYLAYYFGTSLLHFLYDGWIWKVRKPEVAKPLGVG